MATSGFTWANRTKHVSDQIGRMAVAVKGRVLRAGAGLTRGGDDRPGVRADEAVPAGLDGLDPLGVLAQRHAWNLVPVGLLLDSPRVGENHARLGRERREVEIPGWWPRVHVPFEPKAVALDRARRTRMERDDDRLLERAQGIDDPPEGGLPRVRLAVDRGERVGPWFDAGELESLGAFPGDRRGAEVGIEHDVAYLVDALRDALRLQVRHRGAGRGEQEARHAVDENPVELLRHRPIEGAEARLDVRDRDAELRRGECAGERRVRVAIDEDEVGL